VSTVAVTHLRSRSRAGAASPPSSDVAPPDPAGLVLDGLVKRFGAVRAVDGVSLHIPDGAFVSFLGPSGCGKTTLLRLLAGLEAPDAGRIVLDGDDVTHRPAHDRAIGMVFQSLALFPHLDVARNIGYSLRLRKAPKTAVAARVAELLALVDLAGLERRPVATLSGGQRQRVAIARALACEPSLFLLDEPMSALDANLRESLQVELRLLQQRLGVTTVMVTHDQREAMTMSDVVVLLDGGRVAQAGPPLEVFRRPRTAFVARFMGATNLLAARALGAEVAKVGDRRIALAPGAHDKVAGADLCLSVRPGEASVVVGDDVDGPNTLPGEVVFVRDLGQVSECYVDCGLGGEPLVASGASRSHAEVRQGDRVGVHLPPAACVVVEP
jgi:putative spermidine/putrescine transport system ATP-binding protein